MVLDGNKKGWIISTQRKAKIKRNPTCRKPLPYTCYAIYDSDKIAMRRPSHRKNLAWHLPFVSYTGIVIPRALQPILDNHCCTRFIK